jgi:hypothetical protein
VDGQDTHTQGNLSNEALIPSSATRNLLRLYPGLNIGMGYVSSGRRDCVRVGLLFLSPCMEKMECTALSCWLP